MAKTSSIDLPHYDLTKSVIGGFYDVYNHLGCGFLESVYERSLAICLSEAGLRVEQQYPVTVYYRRHAVGVFKADLLVENSVIVELKVARCLHTRHRAQVINILKATTIEVGLVLNFGPCARFKRVVYSNCRKPLNSIPTAST